MGHTSAGGAFPKSLRGVSSLLRRTEGCLWRDGACGGGCRRPDTRSAAGAKFSSFFPHREKSILELCTRLCRGVLFSSSRSDQKPEWVSPGGTNSGVIARAMVNMD